VTATLTEKQREARREIQLPVWLQLIMASPVGVAVVYAALKREYTTIADQVLPIGIGLFGIGFLGLLALLWFGREPRETAGERIGMFLVGLCVVAIGSAIYGYMLYAVGVSLKDLGIVLRAGLGDLAHPEIVRTPRALSAAIGIPLVTGAVLFVMKHNLRSLYGATEAIAGVMMSIDLLSTRKSDVALTSETFTLAVLTASVYLVVTGFDDVWEGLTSPEAGRRDRLASFVQRVASRLITRSSGAEAAGV
jgi:hypothetical protein